MTPRKRFYLLLGAATLLIAAITCRVRTYFNSGTGLLSLEVSVFALRVAEFDADTLIQEQFRASGVSFESKRWLISIEGIMPRAYQQHYKEELDIPLRFYTKYRHFVMFLQSQSVSDSQQGRFFRQIDKSLAEGVLSTIAVHNAKEEAIHYLARGGR